MPPTTADTDEPERRALQADLLAPGPLRSFERAWQILRYYRKRQLFARAWKITAGRWLTTHTLPVCNHVQVREDTQSALRELWQLRAARVERDPVARLNDLGGGAFTFLGERRVLGRPVDWSGGPDRNAERLWGFQLQYQEYLLDAAAFDGEGAWNIIAGLVDDWLKAHSSRQVSTSDDTWHPYCISRRVPVWLMLLAQDKLPTELRQRMLISLAVQVEWLQQHCETDLGGNHLLENAHALALAGLTLTASTNRRDQVQHAWLKRAQAILDTELPRQILAHGEHYERSPMYHTQVLGNLLQIMIVSGTVAPDFAQTCRSWVMPMWEFLESILHADGEIPLFGDSCFGESYPVAQVRSLLSAATATDERIGLAGAATYRNERARATQVSPYWTWRDGDDRWIVDGGAAAENSLPAHGHCDLGGFEASIGGVRWFVDAGVFGYSDDLMRRYCRSSLAHNVMTIDDKNQFDIWSRFRVGFRVQPGFEQGQSNGFRWAHIWHDAYRRIGAGRLHRIVASTPANDWVCIDQCHCPPGRRLIGNLLVGPDVSVLQVSDRSWRLESRQRQCMLQFVGADSVGCRPSWYAPRFGVRIAINSLHYEAQAEAPTAIAWVLSKELNKECPSIRFESLSSRAMAAIVTDRRGATCGWNMVN